MDTTSSTIKAGVDKKVFWSFQFAYWFIYFIYNIFVIHYTTLIQEDTNTYILLSYLFFVCFFGIPLSFLARAVIDQKWFTSFSMIKILFLVIIISFLLANIWVIEIVSLDKIYNEILNVFSITRYRIIPFKWRVYLWEVLFATLLLFGWIAIYLFLKYWKEWNNQKYEIKSTNLQLELTQLKFELAQLRMLRSQISPHFLFNALSSLRALIRRDPGRAEQMISKISEFLRYSLVNKTNWIVPLSEELQAARNYFGIEQVRFGDKLQVVYEIEADAEEFPVPGFILHPIIENSVKYGMDSTQLPLRIIIKAAVTQSRLHIEILNSGRWKERGSNGCSTNTGLENVKNRLQTIYPSKHNLKIEEKDGFVKIALDFENEPG